MSNISYAFKVDDSETFAHNLGAKMMRGALVCLIIALIALPFKLFKVGNTMSESGTVSRGVCETSDGVLTGVVERTAIGFDEQHRISFTDENAVVQYLDFDTPVSMNFWGFTPDYFEYSEKYFVQFLKENINKPKSEFFIPTLVNDLVEKGEAQVKVLTTESKWFGVTYSADRQGVVDKFAELHATGVYPETLF